MPEKKFLRGEKVLILKGMPESLQDYRGLTFLAFV